MLKITFSRMREDRNEPREVKKDFTQNVEKAAKWKSEKKIRSKKHSRTSADVQFKQIFID